MLDEPLCLWRGLPGACGFVKHAYFIAATVTDYAITVDRQTRRHTLSGTVATSVPYLLRQRPLLFVLVTKAGVLRWPIESVDVANNRVVAHLGAQLERE